MNSKTIDDYKRLSEEQAKALKKLANRVREKEKEIQNLYKEMSHLRNIIRTKKGLNNV